MSVKAATYYEVTCDDCRLQLNDVSDYSAMSERGDAVSMWVDADGFVMGDIALCCDHAPRCVHGYGQPADEDDEPMCDVCADGIEES